MKENRWVWAQHNQECLAKKLHLFVMEVKKLLDTWRQNIVGK